MKIYQIIAKIEIEASSKLEAFEIAEDQLSLIDNKAKILYIRDESK